MVYQAFEDAENVENMKSFVFRRCVDDLEFEKQHATLTPIRSAFVIWRNQNRATYLLTPRA